MLFSSKKGMSPLIATVLLIAFAVAMGAMIMNWSAGIESEGASSDYCKDISITTDNGACYGNNVISFDVINDGDKRVNGILLSSISESTSIDITVKDSSLIKGENTNKEIPYPYTEDSVKLEFIPLVINEGEVIECRSGGFSQTELPTC